MTKKKKKTSRVSSPRKPKPTPSPPPPAPPARAAKPPEATPAPPEAPKPSEAAQAPPPEPVDQGDGATGAGASQAKRGTRERVLVEVEELGEGDYVLSVTVPPAPKLDFPVYARGRGMTDEKLVAVFGRALKDAGDSLESWGIHAHGEREVREAEERQR